MKKQPQRSKGVDRTTKVLAAGAVIATAAGLLLIAGTRSQPDSGSMATPRPVATARPVATPLPAPNAPLPQRPAPAPNAPLPPRPAPAPNAPLPQRPTAHDNSPTIALIQRLTLDFFAGILLLMRQMSWPQLVVFLVFLNELLYKLTGVDLAIVVVEVWWWRTKVVAAYLWKVGLRLSAAAADMAARIYRLIVAIDYTFGILRRRQVVPTVDMDELERVKDRLWDALDMVTETSTLANVGVDIFHTEPDLNRLDTSLATMGTQVAGIIVRVAGDAANLPLDDAPLAMLSPGMLDRVLRRVDPDWVFPRELGVVTNRNALRLLTLLATDEVHHVQLREGRRALRMASARLVPELQLLQVRAFGRTLETPADMSGFVAEMTEDLRRVAAEAERRVSRLGLQPALAHPTLGQRVRALATGRSLERVMRTNAQRRSVLRRRQEENQAMRPQWTQEQLDMFEAYRRLGQSPNPWNLFLGRHTPGLLPGSLAPHATLHAIR